MALSATELWSQKDTSQDQNGWGATRYYSVVGTTSELLDERAVVNCPGIPQVNASHPQFRDLRVMNKSAGPGLAERIVSVRYQWMPAGGNPQNQQTDNVFAKPPKILWNVFQRQEQIDKDINGRPLCNSAGDVFSSLPTTNRVSLQLKITRWERKFDIFKMRRFINKLNGSPVIAGNVVFNPLSMLCTFIGPVEEYDLGATAIRMGYEFEIRPTNEMNSLPPQVKARPFSFWTLDVGLRAYASGAKKPADLFYLNNNNMVTQDVFLDGKGAPLEPAEYYVYKSDKTTAAPTQNPKPVKFSIPPVKMTQPDCYLLGFDIIETENFQQLGL